MSEKTVYRVAEIFTSINGESLRAGEPAVFVRFAGCNLRCSYCDTAWAIGADAPCREKSGKEIAEYIRKSGIRDVTLTGGEPLLQKNLHTLMEQILEIPGTRIEVETNGAVDIRPYLDLPRVSMTLDYKVPGSGMEDRMFLQNFEIVRSCDTVKFVVSDHRDLERMRCITDRYQLTRKCHVYLSAVFGKIDPKEIVSFMLAHKLNDVRFQLQIHKFIWDPEKRGV